MKKSMKYKHRGYLWGLSGIVLVVTSIVVASVNLSKLFLPTGGEILRALLVPSGIALGGIVFIVLSRIIPQKEAKEDMEKAKLVADGYSTQAYSYETAYEAIEARIIAWENTPWNEDVQGRKGELIETLRTISRGILDLGKLSAWFNTSLLSEPLYDAAREAVGRIDSNKLKYLSNFIGYCASVTEYELVGDYFYSACKNANKEVIGALELYASMRAKLNSYSGDQKDVATLKAEMEQIIGLL